MFVKVVNFISELYCSLKTLPPDFANLLYTLSRLGENVLFHGHTRAYHLA